MSVKIYPFKQQAPGEFNGGEILENRPVAMTHNPAYLQPYSNLFYWAHAWSEKGSTIGEHPHKAFEIVTFIIKGTIEHYDSANMKWIPIEEGGAQIIRAGSGISHSEKLNAGSHVFQIWFDPDVRNALQYPAAYNDYIQKDFPVNSNNGFNIRKYIGSGSPMEIKTPGVTASDVTFNSGSSKFTLNKNKISSIYLIEGAIKTSSGEMKENDFAVLKDADYFEFESADEGRFFIIENPVSVGYTTYAEMK
ncbi:MAG: pirin family protein [Ignavibacteria bacterium]|nr:pirin family protein [Ignavibacteria bacterium]